MPVHLHGAGGSNITERLTRWRARDAFRIRGIENLAAISWGRQDAAEASICAEYVVPNRE